MDVDALARRMSNDEATVVARIAEIAEQPAADDGVDFRTESAAARAIRDEARYRGLRVAMDTRIATASVKFRLDINFGDPVTPGPQLIDLPSLRRDAPPTRILGYPIETVLAEKIATAITLGAANTRVRDYADIYTLTGKHDLAHARVRDALLATADFRGTTVAPLSSVIDNLGELRQTTYAAYRASLGIVGNNLPENLDDVVAAVTAFADTLCGPAARNTTWQANHRRWSH